MDNYIVSARKYRPTTFESVVGQQSITQTLRNAIRSSHLAQAYLFCGPRGVGKTTCARIFAKTINCLNPTAEHEACNECESCRAFNEQRSMNIHELDAASNNSVEDIRQLIDQVRIPPQIGKYSVFIIDEVHMLSSAAFNAFLKTLEEPPSYAIFILATTEKHKVIPTILSRCQVYDFSRITVSDTIRHLQYVAGKEGVEATEEALGIVAQKADGGMRDALSIFDQLVAFCGNKITYEQTIEVLNVLDTEYYFRLVDCALQNDGGQALLLFNSVLNKGFDAQNFIVGFAQHLRDVLVAKDAVTVRLLETSDNIRKHYEEQAARCSAKFLLQALSLVNEGDIQYRTAKNKRLTVEIMLLKLCQLTAPQEPAALNGQVTLNAPSSQNNQSNPNNSNNPNNQSTPTIQSIQNKPSSAVSQPSVRPVSISIRGMQPQAKQPSAAAEPQPTAVVEKRNSPFSHEAFDEAWLTLPRLFQTNDRLKAALINAQARVENDTTVVLSLVNPLQEQEVQRAKTEILRELADKLQNDNLTLRCEIVEIQQQAFSVAERYSNLRNHNPELDHLREVLDLQIE